MNRNDLSVSDLLKTLLLRLTPEGSLSGADTMDTVLLDTELDGERYLLIRMAPVDPEVQITLSPREREIARMVAKGYPTKAIAGVLNISTWTVCTHVRRLFAKLNVTSRAAMVARLQQLDIILPAATPDSCRAKNFLQRVDEVFSIPPKRSQAVTGESVRTSNSP